MAAQLIAAGAPLAHVNNPHGTPVIEAIVLGFVVALLGWPFPSVIARTVATELGKALARRGHQVHFISTEMPFRFGEFQAGLAFHQVLTPT